MSLEEIIEKIQNKTDRVKYHDERPFTIEEMQELASELDSINENLHDGCLDCNDAVTNDTRDWELEQARKKFISDVLENKELKTRGDMIKATKELDI